MWIKKSEYVYLKSQIAALKQALEYANQEYSRPPASVTVWYMQKGEYEYADLTDVHTYQALGDGRFAFYNNRGWVIAQICDVKDIYFYYPDECNCQERPCCDA